MYAIRSYYAANYQAIEQAVKPAKVMPILKANAYGHGLVEIARHLSTIGAPYLGVAFLEEGILLREYGVTTPILVLGGILGNQIPLFLDYDLTLTRITSYNVCYTKLLRDTRYGSWDGSQ